MVSKLALLDTGAIVAVLSRQDRYHLWAVNAFKKLPPQMLTCEAVLSEVFFLLQKYSGGASAMTELLRAGVLKVLPLADEIEAVTALIEKYKDIPMSYADACLVRMAELCNQAVVVTLDADFKTYRMKRNQRIPLVTPR